MELTSEEDTTKEEQKILQGIVSFGNTDTKQVMKPRMDIFALNVEQSYKEIIPEVIEKGYSRIPVFEESIDNVQGILYVKDLLPYLHRKVFDWTTLLREPYFVPENKKLDDLLNEFKDKKNHLAIVVDEYGGTSGLISLEDIIEEIVGDISDEFDDENLIFSQLDEFNYIFEGKTPLKDFYKVIKLENNSGFEDFKGEAATLLTAPPDKTPCVTYASTDSAPLFINATAALHNVPPLSIMSSTRIACLPLTSPIKFITSDLPASGRILSTIAMSA